ncbi:MAG: OmpW/AlkL family protein [Thermoanaerobaculia bacterium]
MKSVAATILLVAALAAPAFAQDSPVDFTIWGSWVDMQGSNDLGNGFETDLESGSGFGVSTNIFLTDRLSTEIAIFALRSDAALTLDGAFPIDLGRVDLLPVSVGVQFHPAGTSRFDPYIGAGVAYVMADDLESTDLDNVGIGTIEIDDEVTWMANAGLGFLFTDSFGVALDARYMPFEPASKSSLTGGKQDLELTPLVVSAGLRFRF